MVGHRDAWAGSFVELLTLDSPRTDCPMHLPTSPPISGPWTAPGTKNEPSDLRRLAEADAVEQHCSAQHRVCEGNAAVTQRQKRLIRELTGYFPAAPDPAELDYTSAAEWIEEHQAKWMQLPAKSRD